VSARPSIRMSVPEIAGHVQAVLAAGRLQVEPALLVHDLDRVRARISALRAAFPPSTLHAVAVKANPLISVLRACVEAGAGLECASFPEVACSRAAGCEAESIVFDSPAKTIEELRGTLRMGAWLNADNFAELDRIAAIIAEAEAAPRGVVGLRVNPEVGAGTIGTTSVGHRASKMGERLAETQSEILETYARHSWLNGLHVHVGSQGCSLEQLVTGAQRVVELAEAIERVAPGQLVNLDIGGGLPVAYRDTDTPPTLEAYADALRTQVPALFEGRWKLATEFGRSVQANAGFAISRVEYVKPQGDSTLAVVHLGADFLMRPVYNPEDWHHELVVLDRDGHIKTGALQATDVGGPLCFGGDLIGRDLQLPAIEPGDLVVIRDTGAYTLSTWSRHCSRSRPAVMGLDHGAWSEIHAAETPEDVIRLWGG